MNIIEAILLGVLQGITEFLPISSSGHLVIGQRLLGISTPGLTFEIAVHLGSLLSIVFVFWKDLIGILTSLRDYSTQKLILAIIVGTLPAVLVGLYLMDAVEAAFTSLTVVGIALLITGTALIFSRWSKTITNTVSPFSGLLIGVAQALAITPGISRSGATITTALFLGVDRSTAARFSFLLAIPAIIGAGLLQILDLFQNGNQALWNGAVWIGFISSFLTGIVALKILLSTLKSGKFHWFGVYCLLVGLLTLFS